MPQISKAKLKQGADTKLERKLLLFLAGGRKMKPDVLSEFLTRTERVMLGKRLLTIILISRGVSFYKIEKLLGISSSTIARFKLKLEIGALRHTVSRIRAMFPESNLGKILSDLLLLAGLSTEGRKKSLGKLFGEMS